MPGFSESSKHDTAFDRLASPRELRRRELQESAEIYIARLGLNIYHIKHTIRGKHLYFNYNIITHTGVKTVKRNVNLDTLEFKDTKVLPNINTGIICDGTKFRLY